LLDQVGLDHVFDGVALFPNAGGNVVQPHRAAVKPVHQRLQKLAVHQVEACGSTSSMASALLATSSVMAPSAFTSA
jgi:hypothetical protein